MIATHNGARTLHRCLDSIARQRFREFEVLVIDGNSNDGTLSIVATHGDLVSRLVSEPDRGIYDAWNKAVAIARGEWLCFLGADDYFWDADVLGDYRAFFAETVTTRFVYGQIMKLGESGEALGIQGEPWSVAARRFPHAMTVPHVASMHHRSLFEHGRFDAELKIAADYKFLREELLSRGATFFPRIIAGAQTGGVSTKLDQAIPSVLELRRVLRDAGGVPLAWYLQFAKTVASVAVRSLLKP
ncbi:glycosyltransferase family 2 protein [Azospira restricta]|uniref:Glycosyltransferase n=1 Tax=Azospira restricta TaxID=404405 RepID=A0A974PY52_9RHOO|nr:glycosyltransferase family 2 protein [Azospira restricta]QRJ63602.1 glycosyltransferase [Azospira restricta]